MSSTWYRIGIACGLLCVALVFASAGVAAQGGAGASCSAPERVAGQPVELGAVRWMRDFDAARAKAKQTGKPLLVLFTEVPGCSTVKGFGRGALRHPQVVEAIESAFIPVAIYNNVEGADRRVLRSFGEPTWNNPVVRIMTHDRKALARRFAGPYRTGALVKTMLAGLKAAKRPVPGYLSGLASALEAQQRGTRRASLSMYCFWSGEAKLGDVPGVVATRTGHQDGREVVEVEYDPSAITYRALVTTAKRRGAATGALTTTKEEQRAAQAVFGKRAARARGGVRGAPGDDRKQLQKTAWRLVPMTPWQATRVNAAVGHGRDPSRWLSPRQRALYLAIRANPRASWPDPARARFADAWRASVAVWRRVSSKPAVKRREVKAARAAKRG